MASASSASPVLLDRVEHAAVRLEAELRLATIVHGEVLKEEGAESGPGATANCAVYQEAVKARTVVGQVTDTLNHELNIFLSKATATGKNVGGALLA